MKITIGYGVDEAEALYRALDRASRDAAATAEAMPLRRQNSQTQRYVWLHLATVLRLAAEEARANAECRYIGESVTLYDERGRPLLPDSIAPRWGCHGCGRPLRMTVDADGRATVPSHPYGPDRSA